MHGGWYSLQKSLRRPPPNRRGGAAPAGDLFPASKGRVAAPESGPDLFKCTKFNPENIFFVKSGDLIW